MTLSYTSMAPDRSCGSVNGPNSVPYSSTIHSAGVTAVAHSVPL